MIEWSVISRDTSPNESFKKPSVTCLVCFWSNVIVILVISPFDVSAREMASGLWLELSRWDIREMGTGGWMGVTSHRKHRASIGLLFMSRDNYWAERYVYLMRTSHDSLQYIASFTNAAFLLAMEWWSVTWRPHSTTLIVFLYYFFFYHSIVRLADSLTLTFYHSTLADRHLYFTT